MSAAPKIAIETPAAPTPELSDASLRAAIENNAGRPVIDALLEALRVDEESLAQVLGAKLKFPVLRGAGYLELTPLFDLLGLATCAQRGCVLVSRGSERLAVTGDPFDESLRAPARQLQSRPERAQPRGPTPVMMCALSRRLRRAENKAAAP